MKKRIFSIFLVIVPFLLVLLNCSGNDIERQRELNNMNNIQAIERIFNNNTRSSRIYEAVLYVENSSGDFSMNLGYGGRDKNSPIFSASVSKLFVTASILILQEQGKLSLDDYLSDYLDENTLSGLHIYKGVDYSNKLTLSNLLFQTSGLPHGFEYFLRQLARRDFEVTFEEVLEKTKSLTPLYAPNSKNRANYSDINFRLLVHVIEKVTNTSIDRVYQEYIFNPLGLTNTYLPTKADDFVPNIYHKNDLIQRPLFFTSSYNYDAVTTSSDLMRFLKAFFKGELFNANVFNDLAIYRKLQMEMGGIRYGGGYMQLPLGTMMTMFMGKGELLGHSGSTGSFAFYHPHTDLFFVGDLNQMSSPSLPIRMAMRLAMAVK